MTVLKVFAIIVRFHLQNVISTSGNAVIALNQESF